jgi:spore germination cell wall hydrolase CwlJ-like protein
LHFAAILAISLSCCGEAHRFVCVQCPLFSEVQEVRTRACRATTEKEGTLGGEQDRPRKAALGAILFAAMLVAAGPSAADTANWGERAGKGGTYRSAVTDALGAELAALSAFSETRDFARAAALARIDPEQDRRARQEERVLAIIDALNSQDARAARQAGGAQAAMTAQQLLAHLGDDLDPRVVDRIEVKERSEEWSCLAEALYFEARGEGIDGQLAVAEVILNRVDSKQYPDSVCDVVRQGADSKGCQFSYMCDGLKEHIANRRAYERSGKIAWLMLAGKPRTLTDEALYFHATSVKPSWSRIFERTVRIGGHIFYRPKVRLTQG